ncbi:DUF3995 domain-containing protein [Streptomyces sp. YIM 98790]|uniref:DUF3995 domain-containing protein n=1 Tax=Streptomyces sp. YIM 98790 TaxID=2689077 RepID=UPI001FB6E2C6|nr:DUF3995 domain-containing protein [Streptomyces sp. YIM 98790]
MDGRPGPWARWCGYGAFVLGVGHAGVSFYWGAGGDWLLDTVGGELERLARERGPGILAVVWGTGVAKLFAAALGLALVREWGRGHWRRVVLAPAWAASAVLVLYGGVLVVGQALVEAGVLGAAQDADRKALRWHLYLWDPWFLVRGLLLGAAAWGCTRGRRRRT